MENETKTPEQIQHETNKFIRERLAWIHFRMQSMQFFLEEAQMALETKGVLEAICLDLQKKIEEVEPPVAKEPEAPKGHYVIDAGTVLV